MPSMDELVSIKERVEAQFLGAPGVTGIDVGYKEVGGQLTDQVAIRVHVAHKTDSVPDDQRVPAEIDGAVTDVLERRYEPQVLNQQVATVTPQADTTHYTTLEGGISMGPSRVIACVDNTFHNGDRMVQPSRIDTGVPPGDEFGSLARETLSANVDGAVIAIDAGRATACQIVDIGLVAGTRAATLGMAVRKRGRTTLLTYGSVDGLSFSVNIDYGDGIGVKTLTNQISIAADTTKNPLFSDHGDSGSVIVDDSGFVVGLLFAGAGTSTVANPIAAVQSELNISMCIGKSILKDFKDHRKDIIKDKEIRKELIKDKEIRKDLLPDNKVIKDVRDVKPIREVPPDPGPVETPTAGQAGLEQRLAAVESKLSQLTGFIGPELRPDLTGSAYSGESPITDDDVTALRAELQRQVDEATAAKAELDAPYT